MTEKNRASRRLPAGPIFTEILRGLFTTASDCLFIGDSTPCRQGVNG